MSLASQICAHCKFENPRAFRACAACGKVLGTAPRKTGRYLSGEGEGTQVMAPSMRHADAVEELLDEDELEEIDAAPTEEVEPPLVGRQEISAILKSGIETALTASRPTLVAVEGEAGSGRTRLLFHAAELAARIAPNVQVLYGLCREGDGPSSVFSRILLERLGVTPSSSPSLVRAQIAMFVGQALASSDALAIGETTHLLGTFAGVPFPDSPFLAGLDPQSGELKKRQFGALRRFFEGDARARPMLVLLDNAHHAEEGMWEILEVVLGAEAPIAIVMAGDAPTAERASKVTAAGGVITGPIAPLSEGDVASMLHVILPTLLEAPEPVVAAIAHRSNGNPSALRELVFALVEAGLFVRTENGLRPDVAKLTSGELPVTMDDAIRARLARLDDLERATVDRASVLGEVVLDRAVFAMMRSERPPHAETNDPLTLWADDEDERAFEAALSRLEEKGFFEVLDVTDFPGVRAFRFAHGETRVYVLRHVDEELKKKRHATIAHWITATLDTDAAGVAILAAPHFEKAGMPDRAGRAHLEAARHEAGQARTEAALHHAQRALELLVPEEAARRVDAMFIEGSTLHTLGRYDDALAVFTRVLQASFRLGARGKGGAALNRIARVHRARGEDERAHAVLVRALELFRLAGDLRGVAATLDDLAQIVRLRGDLESAMNAASEALQIRQGAGDARGEAVSLMTIAGIEHSRGNLDAALSATQQAAEIRVRTGDRGGVAQTLNVLAAIVFERGDVERAESAWMEALQAARETADRRTQTFVLNNLGESLSELGRHEEARVMLLEARAHAHEAGDKRMMAEVERNLGLVALRRNEDEADATLAQALVFAKDYGAREAICNAQRAIGQLRARTLFDASGAVDRRAEEAFLAAIDGFRDIGMEKDASRALADLGRHLLERGDTDGARDRLREARSIMRKIGLRDIEKVDQTLASLG